MRIFSAKIKCGDIMIIQRVQQQPNFCALRIKPINMTRKRCIDILSNKNQKTLKTIFEASQNLRQTTYAHLDILLEEENGLIPKVYTKNSEAYSKFFEPLEPEKAYPDYLTIRTIWTGNKNEFGQIQNQPYNLLLKLKNAQEAQKAYESIKNASSEYERASILTKLIDDLETEKITKADNKTEVKLSK